MIKHNLQRKIEKEKHLIKNLRNLTTLVNKITKELKTKTKNQESSPMKRAKNYLKTERKPMILQLKKPKKLLKLRRRNLKIILLLFKLL